MDYLSIQFCVTLLRTSKDGFIWSGMLTASWSSFTSSRCDTETSLSHYLSLSLHFSPEFPFVFLHSKCSLFFSLLFFQISGISRMWLSLYSRHSAVISKKGKGYLMSVTELPKAAQSKMKGWSIGFPVVWSGGGIIADLAVKAKVDANFEFAVFVSNYAGDVTFHWVTQDGSNVTSFLTPNELMERLSLHVTPNVTET